MDTERARAKARAIKLPEEEEKLIDTMLDLHPKIAGYVAEYRELEESGNAQDWDAARLRWKSDDLLIGTNNLFMASDYADHALTAIGLRHSESIEYDYSTLFDLLCQAFDTQ